MSFHVLHIFSHGAYLHKNRGRLYQSNGEKSGKSLPIENIKAIIIAARGVVMSSQLMGTLLEKDCIILHCNEKYQPSGITAPLSRTINNKILNGQIHPRGKFVSQAWKKTLGMKIRHQIECINAISIDENPLENSTAALELNEAHSARIYFRFLFKHLDAKGQTRSKRQSGWLNAYLNYGYAVLSALVHRSIAVHGLLPQLGINHKPRYNASPLVYDLMEPYRPVVDCLTAKFIEEWTDLSNEPDIAIYGKFIGLALREFRVPHNRYTLKLLDAIDFSVRSYANAFEDQDPDKIWIPLITWDYYGKVSKFIPRS